MERTRKVALFHSLLVRLRLLFDGFSFSLSLSLSSPSLPPKGVHSMIIVISINVFSQQQQLPA